MKLRQQIIIVLLSSLVGMLLCTLALILIFEWQIISANQHASLNLLERDAVTIAQQVETLSKKNLNNLPSYTQDLSFADSTYYIFDEFGVVVQSNNDVAISKPIQDVINLKQRNWDEVFNLTQGQVGDHSVAQNPITAGYRKVFVNNQTPLVVTVVMERSDTIAATTNNIQVFGVSAFIVFPIAYIIVITIILGFLAYYIIERVSRPINQIRDGLKFLDRNQYALRVDGKLLSRPNELGELARSASNLAHRFRDIYDTLEQKVEERTESLSQAKARTEAILRSVGQGLVVTDALRNIIFANDASTHLLGYTQLELLQHKWPDIAKPVNDQGQPIEFHNTETYRALEGDKTVYGRDYSYTHKSGTAIPMSVTASAIHVRNGQTDGAVIVFRDITEDKAIDRAKSEFVSLASHQLRTPLSSINWFTEMLMTGDAGAVNEEQHNYLEEIHESNRRMVELVDSLLNVSRIDLGTFAVNPKTISITELAQSVIKEIEPDVFKKKIGLDEVYDPKLPTIQADPKLLRIVFQNLLSNAVKYTPDEGHIEIRVELDKADNKQFLIAIRDSGFGIPEHQHDKIFTKLFRAENVVRRDTQGTGLGLYLVKSIVDYSQGRIWFDSAENQGTTFYVQLPLLGMKSKQGTKELS